MIFRAVVYARQPGTTPPAELEPECHVFFESASPERASSDVRLIVSFSWGLPVEDVGVRSLYSEMQLRLQSSGAWLHDDAVLFECDWRGGPTYCDPARTLLMVRPTTLLRLLNGQAQAAAHTDALRRLRVDLMPRQVRDSGPGLAGTAQDRRAA